MIWFTFHSFFSSLLEELGSSCLSFFSLSPIIINPYPHPPSLTTSTSLLSLHFSWWSRHCTHAVAAGPHNNNNNKSSLSPSSFLLSLYILFFLLFILRAGWNQPCAIGKALVRAPMVLERPPKLFFFLISSSLGTEALHLTLLHPLPPYVACKASWTALAQPAVWRTTLWPPPLLLYSTSHNIYIYTFFQSLVFLYLAFIYSVFLYYVFLSEFVTYLFILFLVLDDTAFTVRWLLFCIF